MPRTAKAEHHLQRLDFHYMDGAFQRQAVIFYPHRAKSNSIAESLAKRTGDFKCFLVSSYASTQMVRKITNPDEVGGLKALVELEIQHFNPTTTSQKNLKYFAQALDTIRARGRHLLSLKPLDKTPLYDGEFEELEELVNTNEGELATLLPPSPTAKMPEIPKKTTYGGFKLHVEAPTPVSDTALVASPEALPLSSPPKKHHFRARSRVFPSPSLLVAREKEMVTFEAPIRPTTPPHAMKRIYKVLPAIVTSSSDLSVADQTKSETPIKPE